LGKYLIKRPDPFLSIDGKAIPLSDESLKSYDFTLDDIPGLTNDYKQINFMWKGEGI